VLPPIAHIQSTVGWTGKRGNDAEQIKSTEAPKMGAKGVLKHA
jgi:hypothetical protein